MNKVFSLLTVATFVATTFYGDMPCNQPSVKQEEPCNKPVEPCAQPVTKPKPPVSCECLERGMGLPMDQKCYPPAYNAPANINVRNCWDMDVFASFLYWHVSQEGMYTAVQSPVLNADNVMISSGTVTSPSFEYKPGFKVGIGFNTDYDDWTGWLEYTWMHQKTHHVSRTDATTPFRTDIWVITDSADSLASTNFENGGFVSSKWKMNLDMLDAAFSRPFYQGKRITITPFAGMRALWIRQNFNINFNQFSIAGEEFNTGMRSHSWAVGPMLGTIGHWMLGTSFRFEGKAGGALLYTRYKKVSQHETIPNSDLVTVSMSSSMRDLNVLRPMVDIGVGLGWGTYLGCQEYYLDFSARYDFNLLWDQNVMVQFLNAMNEIPGTSGNLYMHGLTLSGRFDF